MPTGFFSNTELAVCGTPEYLSPQCGKCKLCESCQSPKMPVAGKGKKGIMVVGEAPGENEDRQGKPFVGKSGTLLQRALMQLGVDLFHDCWVTNALRCRPSNTNTIRDKKAVDYCRPYLISAIKEYQPKVIILLGKNAIRSLIEHLWSSSIDGVARWAGWRIPCQRYNAWICPTYHPAHVLREMEERGGNPVTQLHWTQHLERALVKTKRPWKEVPDYQQQVKIILDPAKAAVAIRGWFVDCSEVAFDYETNMLKPDHPDGRIVACSISDGDISLAYPWHGEAIVATQELLTDKHTAKVGWNLKFEERWTRAKLGVRVANWQDDGMLRAHCLDSRRGTTSMKFQAFVHLGLEDYSVRMKSYLEGEGGYGSNKIQQANLSDMLLYNGIDSLVEFKMAQIQRRLHRGHE